MPLSKNNYKAPIPEGPKTRKDLCTNIIYREEKRVSVSFTTLVIRVNRLEEVFGSIEEFHELLDITMICNGELLWVKEMQSPASYLEQMVVEKLVPKGFQVNVDLAFVSEYMLDYMKMENNLELLGKPHPSLKEINWLKSVIEWEGQYVWLK